MGFFDILKGKSNKKVNPYIQIDEHCIYLKTLGFEQGYFTNFTSSPSKEYYLAWDSEHWVLLTPQNIVGEGRGKALSQGKVSDTGNLTFTGRNTKTFYAYSLNGELLIQKKFKAYLDNCAISPDGRLALCRTYSCDYVNDDLKYILFDLEQKKLKSKFDHHNLFPNSIVFDMNEEIIYCYCPNNLEYRYTFKGKFLDEEKWFKNARIQFQSEK